MVIIFNSYKQQEAAMGQAVKADRSQAVTDKM